jgi:hypothetical protein
MLQGATSTCEGVNVSETTEPDDATRNEERSEAESSHTADRPPTSSEEAAADRGRERFEADEEEVRKRYEEMNEIGADVKGEGQID